ncbi:hypothetical protein DICPUDRAFT_152946 [Dictyostelium purpureum]|uniref:HECT-type E3 ubiquitin transferase n=1 Tax=Dictyostelium purpureum TaxID=5786 RepID=F0ZMN9_DICPU|nr:uncharacterized protein DICPUDRAFT_152946 [Dictyostelium purpureum]EGC34776.1 hypothetical protein DICPUDRAFT_152946 [Dictyostelium purpureum]|eukprot:XP_003288691.1 hypothetical protein DICPUDRAFT_152946 [Dictyostelium purpureum]
MSFENSNNNNSSNSIGNSKSNDTVEKEKERLRFIISQYFQQITKGCGEKISHHSEYCCHNPNFQKILDPTQAAMKSLKLGKDYQEKYLCSYLYSSTAEKLIITNRYMKTLVDLSSNAKNYSNIVDFIVNYFSTPSSIITSFKSEKKQDYDDETYFEGLDINDINQIFSLLTGLNNKKVDESLKSATRLLSNNLKYNSVSYKEKEQLKPLVFLLANDFIHDLDNRTILSNVFVAFSLLQDPMKDVIIKWYNSLSKEYFIKTIINYEQFISVRIMSDEVDLHKDPAIKGACSALQLLSKINDLKRYVPFTDFYNDAINEDLDLFKDFNQANHSFTYANFPCVLNTITKGQYLQIEHALSQNNHRTDFGRLGLTSALDFLIFKIRRESIITDTLDRIAELRHGKNEFKKELKVHFIGEEGIDEGGVKREFFQLIVRRIFDPEYGMFKYNNETRCFWFNPDSEDLTEFQLIGILLGLALYNNIILDVHFPLVIFKKLLNLPLSLEDIESLDPTLFSSLMNVKTTTEEVEYWSLYFSVDYESFGQTKTFNLKKDGKDIPVTNENREEYLQLYVDYLLNKSISSQFKAFYIGFKLVCDSTILNILKPEELSNLVCGVEDLNFDELELFATYEGGYTKDDTTIKNFWKVLHSLSDEDKKRFLTFVTGGDRVPYGGLGKMEFTITKTADSDRLPSAHTCFNTLILPAYPGIDKLRDLLTKAITHYEGFGLK